jgi:hypothetical protein
VTGLNIYTEEMPPGLFDSLARIERRQTQDEGRRAADHGNGDDGGPSLAWTWRHMGALAAAAVFIFTLGMNWHRIDAQGEKLDTHVKQNTEDHATFAHKDVVDSEFNNLKQQLDRIEKALERGRR